MKSQNELLEIARIVQIARAEMNEFLLDARERYAPSELSRIIGLESSKTLATLISKRDKKVYIGLERAGVFVERIILHEREKRMEAHDE
ncbi:hypothetical protein GWN42_31200 [candidate division KSB1 bacterium]|nr:hypothetical protein [Phycisphaerae bacterium]NIQ92526.1 hypothetical protein [Deltaproteobacteria bacterium]NIV97136.1 hypothetical protein [candidate division KSB1 bacterium]